MNSENEPIDDPITWQEVLSHLELGCWVSWLLIPAIWYVQGESVSRDQFVVRCTLAALVVIAAPTLTFLRRRSESTADDASGTSEPEPKGPA